MTRSLNEMMPNQGGQFFKATDLEPREALCLRILGIVQEEHFGEMKTIVSFVGIEKRLSLNVTNKDTLVATHGEDPDEMAGQPIVLYRTTTTYNGDPSTPALRFRKAENKDLEKLSESEGKKVPDGEIPS